MATTTGNTPIYDTVTATLGYSLEDIKLSMVKAGLAVTTPRPISKRARHRYAKIQNTVLADAGLPR